jgi:uncharacterized membrane protein YphA (DoxX/SURF4 family)
VPDLPRSAWLILRILVGVPFIASGVFNAINWDASNAFNAILLGETLAPALTVLGILQIVGGLSIVSGYQMRFGALLLLAFLIPATIRHFLAARALVGDDPLTVIAKRGQLSCVEKNSGLIGIMIFLLIVDLRSRVTR